MEVAHKVKLFPIILSGTIWTREKTVQGSVQSVRVTEGGAL